MSEYVSTQISLVYKLVQQKAAFVWVVLHASTFFCPQNFTDVINSYVCKYSVKVIVKIKKFMILLCSFYECCRMDTCYLKTSVYWFSATSEWQDFTFECISLKTNVVWDIPWYNNFAVNCTWLDTTSSEAMFRLSVQISIFVHIRLKLDQI